jgi:hypothetical protein
VLNLSQQNLVNLAQRHSDGLSHEEHPDLRELMG